MVSEGLMPWAPIVQRWENLDEVLGTECWIVRDDLLPFPLAGNKVRKIEAELSSIPGDVGVLITNGGVDSNHCRTVAMFAAQRGIQAHLVLHGDESDFNSTSIKMLEALGATFDIGPASTIRERVEQAEQRQILENEKAHIVSGGGHTAAGAQAFKDAGIAAFRTNNFDQVFVASGTGATQGGLVAAAEISSLKTEVIGVSVARDKSRGIPPVEEAAKWAGAQSPHITFLDEYRAGGYGKSDTQVEEAVQLGWRLGVPLDFTYTGKAFSAMVDLSRRDRLGEKVLFWHTGGLFNWVSLTQKLAHPN
ncbi:pyridoxal-phosphate dependent enzyme [Corynebacterium stationis]|uniref:1-aminocyclopropane-1-carboxylate deaminase/D-cysteine desulfhydrase n=1 Tax=Corynebacterium stationis TaxID=1705 RepID=UPI00273AB657|nr:pyridoxal-phosphate dependent enzyme [Corynebacterium stationis]WLP87119.1 pyridoxal-phosphate dependent enzyme [Corynebacterium stationis]